MYFHNKNGDFTIIGYLQYGTRNDWPLVETCNNSVNTKNKTNLDNKINAWILICHII